jgi:ketosteroid isomerase-like protein
MPTTTADSKADVVKSIYEAFDRGDVATVLAHFDEKIEISQSDEVPWGGVYRGHAGAIRFLTALTEHIETRVDIGRLVVAGDSVVEIGRTEGRARAPGRTFSIDEIHVWRLRDGKAVRMEAFVDNDAMLSALGQA